MMMEAKGPKVHNPYTDLDKPPDLSAALFYRAKLIFQDKDDERHGVVELQELYDYLLELKEAQTHFIKELGEEGIERMLTFLRAVLTKVEHKDDGQKVATIKLSNFVKLVTKASVAGHEEKKKMREELGRMYTAYDPNISELQNEDGTLNRFLTTQETKGLADFHEKDEMTICRENCSRAWKRNCRNKRNVMPCWKSAFIRIEADFGPSVASFFYFVQSMVWLNLAATLISLFIIIPGLSSMKWDLDEKSEYVGYFMGTGLERSFLFYGDYLPRYPSPSNTSLVYVTQPDVDGGRYRMDLAWIFVNGAILFISLLKTLDFINHESRNNDTLRFDDASIPFCKQLFSSIDFSLSSQSGMKIQRHFAFRSLNTLMIEKEDYKVHQKQQDFFGGKYTVLCRRFIGITLTMLLCVSTTACVSLLIVYEDELIPSLESLPFFSYFNTLFVPFLIAFFKFLTPKLLVLIVEFEGYARSKDRFVQTFLRIFVIRMFYVLVVLFQTMYTESNQPSASVENVCNETAVGIIYYKMLMLDVFIEFMTAVVGPSVSLCCKNQCDLGGDGLSEADRKLMVDSLIPESELRKNEFTIPENIIDIQYRQALIWSGMSFSPVLPFLGVFANMLTVWFRKYQVLHLTRAPLKPMGVSNQKRFFRGIMVVTLCISIIPYSFFLRRNVDCGPHYGSTPIDVFFTWTDEQPAWFGFIIEYLQNIVLLWLVLFMLFIYSKFLTTEGENLHGELAVLRRRLKMEVKEKQLILRENGIELDEDKERGRHMFASWMEENDMAEFGLKYSRKFHENYFDDLLEVAKLDSNEISKLLHSWHSPSFPVLEFEVKFFMYKLQQKRVELI